MNTNSIKSLAPVYIYIVIKRYTSEEAPASQKDINNFLLENYNIKLERKALGRILNTLEDSGLNIERKSGGWYAA